MFINQRYHYYFLLLTVGVLGNVNPHQGKIQFCWGQKYTLNKYHNPPLWKLVSLLRKSWCHHCFWHTKVIVCNRNNLLLYEKAETFFSIQLIYFHREVIEGTETLKLLEEQDTYNERPLKECRIKNCGIVDVNALYSV